MAEDARVSARILEESLIAEGYGVRVTGNGEQALVHATERTPDLIISDVMMRGMDGYEFCRRLRAHPPSSEVPIILLTSRGGIKEKRMGFGAGADDYRIKPADPVELKLRTVALLARSKAWPAEGQAQHLVGRLIAVFSLRGGAGVISLAINLAVTLARMWQVEVPLVDLDLESGLGALMLNLKPRHS